MWQVLPSFICWFIFGQLKCTPGAALLTPALSPLCETPSGSCYRVAEDHSKVSQVLAASGELLRNFPCQARRMNVTAHPTQPTLLCPIASDTADTSLPQPIIPAFPPAPPLWLVDRSVLRLGVVLTRVHSL